MHGIRADRRPHRLSTNSTGNALTVPQWCIANIAKTCILSAQALKRDRSTWEEDAGAPHPRRKARKSMGRRVSFAPDAQLETRHLYQVPPVRQLLQ